ncbi:DUF6538 domain-containing protein [Sulfitobacter sp. 1A15106]|uniref:DUF6538 domain-containing protein n=1 Tax=Sulfitobacter sp. 1A15106 TaxID=3368590 RepID=UPI0037468ED4
MIDKIGNTYYLRRRVPARFAEVDSRTFVKFSLKTDSLRDAQRKAESAWAKLCDGWEAKLAGDIQLAEHNFAQAKRDAQRMGLAYKTPTEIAGLPLAEIIARAEAAAEGPEEATAALGLAPLPEITVSRALDEYFRLATDKIKGKTDDQIRRWRNPRKKAFKLFIEVVGDRALGSLTRDDMLAFREYLIERVNREEITSSSANKDIIHLVGVLRYINEMKNLGLTLPVDRLALKKDPGTRRAAFSRDWIENKLLAKGALDGMGNEARRVVHIMVNTGARPSEICGTLAHHFDLDGPIPMMMIRPEGRQLKNHQSSRDVPLAGVALEAAREAVEEAKRAGRTEVFPTYCGKDKLSDAVNKFLRENGLKESDRTTLYSLRHAFEDRMIEAGVLDRVRRDLFGHALQEQRYGEGGGDEVRYKAVLAVAL